MKDNRMEDNRMEDKRMTDESMANELIAIEPKNDSITLEDRVEFLEQAKDMVLEYQDAAAEAQEQQDIVDRLENSLNKEKKELEDKIRTTLKKRRGEIEDGFERQIRKIRQDLDRAQKKLDSEREKAIGSRVADETREMRVEKTNLVTELQSLFRKEQIPLIGRTPLYLALHDPVSLKEGLVILLYILLLYVILPAGIIFGFTNHSKTIMLVIAIVNALVWLMIYIGIHGITRKNRKEAWQKIRQIRKQIKIQKKQIAGREKSIRKENDDSVYELKEFKDAVDTFQTSYDTTCDSRDEALRIFDTETKTQIKEELTAGYAEKLDSLELRLKDADELLTDLRRIEQNLNRSMNERFANALGQEFLQADSLDALIRETKNGAASLTEAQERVRATVNTKNKKRN